MHYNRYYHYIVNQMQHKLPSLIIIAFGLGLLIQDGKPQKPKPPTNPRQIRSGSSTFNSTTDQAKLVAIVKFLYYANKQTTLQDYGQPCDPALHEEWAGPYSSKDILSDDFNKDHSWHNKICNFLGYLDCNQTNKTCVCAAEERFDLKLVYEDALDNATLDKFKPNRKKRRCRVIEGELCNFVRILPAPLPDTTIPTTTIGAMTTAPAAVGRPFPGVDFDIPDFFECDSDSNCKEVGREADGFFYERCVKREVRGSGVRNWDADFWKFVLILELVWIYSLVSW